MNSLHSLRTECRSEWQMPQNRISICTSRSVGLRRGITVDANCDVGLAAEQAFVLYVVGCMLDDSPLSYGSQCNLPSRVVMTPRRPPNACAAIDLTRRSSATAGGTEPSQHRQCSHKLKLVIAPASG